MNNRPEKILLSASGPKTTRSYLSLIRESQMGMISTCESARESWKALEFEAFSIVIIISPLMDGDGYELAKQASKTAAGVLFVTTQERYEDAVSHLRGSGVCVFSTAMGRRLFHQSLEMLEAVHIRLSRQVPQEQMLKDKLKEIRLVSRAKCLLIQYEHMTEEEAHRKIEREAMNQRRTKMEIAEDVLHTYL